MDITPLGYIHGHLYPHLSLSVLQLVSHPPGTMRMILTIKTLPTFTQDFLRTVSLV